MNNLSKGLIAAAVLASVGWGYHYLSQTRISTNHSAVGEVSVEQDVAFKEGEHFMSIDPIFGLPNNSVVEVFWYGCPHCYKMEKVISSPEFKEKSKGWSFQKFHLAKKDGVVGFDFRVYSALKQMGLEETVGKAYMTAIHEDGLDRSNLGDFAKKHGISMETLTVLSDNDESKNYYNFISQFSSRKEFKGVPAFIVEGQYLINLKYDVADVANFLLSKGDIDEAVE
jgi:thiol:disulfide interchange protein DsbA